MVDPSAPSVPNPPLVKEQLNALETPCCGAWVLHRREPVWYDGEGASCPVFSHGGAVHVSDHHARERVHRG